MIFAHGDECGAGTDLAGGSYTAGGTQIFESPTSEYTPLGIPLIDPSPPPAPTGPPPPHVPSPMPASPPPSPYPSPAPHPPPQPSMPPPTPPLPPLIPAGEAAYWKVTFEAILPRDFADFDAAAFIDEQTNFFLHFLGIDYGPIQWLPRHHFNPDLISHFFGPTAAYASSGPPDEASATHMGRRLTQHSDVRGRGAEMAAHGAPFHAHNARWLTPAPPALTHIISWIPMADLASARHLVSPVLLVTTIGSG